MNLHIVIVGTSILSNHRWKRGEPLPATRDLQAAVKRDPRKASAELNALLHYVDSSRCDRVHLIATDTPEGRLCRDVVGVWLHSRNIPAEHGAQPDLLPAGSADPYAAAAYLRDRIFSVAQSAHERGATLYLNLTGGLKLETAVAAATATLLGIADITVTAYYAHESMTEPVELPILSLHPRVLRRLRDLFGPEPRPWIHLPGSLDADLKTALRERMITFQYDTEGTPSSARLTDFGRFVLKRLANLHV